MLQIQPSYSELRSWISFAEKEGLCFELHELIKTLCTSSEADGKECILTYKDSGLSCSLHGAYMDVNPFSADTDFAALSRKKVEFSCSLAKHVGATNVVFHSSCYPLLRGSYFQSHIKAAAAYYSELAEQTGLNIFLENCLDVDPDPLAGILENITSDKVKCCLDIGHANISRVPVSEWFDVLGQYIGYIHLSDNNGTWDEHLPLGSGSICWEKASELYESLHRDLPITLETGSLESTMLSFQYLKERNYFHA